MGQQPRAGYPALNRTARCFRLHDLVASSTSQLRPNLPDHFEMFRHILQYFRNIFAQRLQSTATVRAGFRLRQHLTRLAWQMLRQRLPRTFRHSIHDRCHQWSSGGSGLLRSAGFQLVQLQLQLLQLLLQLLRFVPEVDPPQLGDQQFQPLDLFISRG